MYFWALFCFWYRQPPSFVYLRAENFDFHEKTLVFELKMTIFQILIKWPKMIVSSCYIAQNDRNEQTNSEIHVRNQFLTRNIAKLRGKAWGYKNEQKFFCHFWFCAICVSANCCLIFKIVPSNLPRKSFILNVSALSYLQNWLR